jgi:NAD(P)-dependent dehydrogenase (short-subunit alcohol dehydrogenase family)
MSELHAIVTGGSTGIGAAICRKLIAADYHVICMARRAPTMSSSRMTSVSVDLTDVRATRAAVAEVARDFPVTTIVHNAGAIRERALEQVTVDDIEELTRLHLVTPVLLVQGNLAHMKAAKYGRIVLVSTRAVLGLAKRTAYASTKAGLLGLARTWALELGEFGITSNVVAPGPIEETEMFHEVIPKGSPKMQSIASAVPVRRLGKPDDVARAVMFFAAPEAGFVTGQTLFVCGGTSVGSISY